MAPRKDKITAKDLVSRNPSSVVKAIYERAFKDAYREQQELLKKAKKLSK